MADWQWDIDKTYSPDAAIKWQNKMILRILNLYLYRSRRCSMKLSCGINYKNYWRAYIPREYIRTSQLVKGNQDQVYEKNTNPLRYAHPDASENSSEIETKCYFWQWHKNLFSFKIPTISTNGRLSCRLWLHKDSSLLSIQSDIQVSCNTRWWFYIVTLHTIIHNNCLLRTYMYNILLTSIY